jgi:hypothetical protein
MLNGLVGWAGGLLGIPDLTLRWILRVLFAPFALLMGIPWSKAVQGGISPRRENAAERVPRLPGSESADGGAGAFSALDRDRVQRALGIELLGQKVAALSRSEAEARRDLDELTSKSLEVLGYVDR